MGVREYPTIDFSVHKFIHHQSFWKLTAEQILSVSL
jgi:hypothetical protein